MNQLTKLERELSNTAFLVKTLFKIQMKEEVTVFHCVQAFQMLTPTTQQSA